MGHKTKEKIDVLGCYKNNLEKEYTEYYIYIVRGNRTITQYQINEYQNEPVVIRCTEPGIEKLEAYFMTDPGQRFVIDCLNTLCALMRDAYYKSNKLKVAPVCYYIKFSGRPVGVIRRLLKDIKP